MATTTLKRRKSPKTNTNPAKTSATDFKEAILFAFDRYTGILNAILSDYVPDPGMMVEVEAAAHNVRSKLEEIGEDAVEPSFEKAYEMLKGLPDHDFNSGKLLSLIAENDEYETEDAISLLRDSDMVDYLQKKGYAFIKMNSLQMKNKLEEFVKAELYPNYNDEDEYEI